MAFDNKTESEVIDIGFDLSALVISPITISSAVITVEKSYGSALASTLTLVGSADITGTNVAQRISGGIEGNRYLIICTITTSVGEVYQVSDCITIQEAVC